MTAEFRCDRGTDHSVTVEWEVRGGVRTGRLAPYCWTCKRHVPATVPVAPKVHICPQCGHGEGSLVQSLREQLREAKLAARSLEGDIRRVTWERDEAVRQLSLVGRPTPQYLAAPSHRGSDAA